MAIIYVTVLKLVSDKLSGFPKLNPILWFSRTLKISTITP